MKKKLFLFIITLLLYRYVSSQNYPFVDTGKVWSVLETTEGGIIFYNTLFYTFFGDTTIGNNIYKKLFTTSDSTFSNISINGYVGAIRDSGQNVYFCSSYSNNPVLIYNFGVNIGDTIKPANTNNEAYYLVVDSIDSIHMMTGQYRKRIIFKLPFIGSYYQEEWIEGIGSIHGILHHLLVYGELIYDFAEDLLCYTENDTILYKNQEWNICYLTNVGIEKENKVKSRIIFPNPVYERYFIIGFNEFFIGQVLVYNMLGKLIFQQQVSYPCLQTNVNLPDIKQGVYNVVTINKSGQITYNKIIINN